MAIGKRSFDKESVAFYQITFTFALTNNENGVCDLRKEKYGQKRLTLKIF